MIGNRKRLRIWALGLGAVVLAGAAYVQFGLRTEASGPPDKGTTGVAAPAKGPTVQVKSYRVTRADLVRTILVTGELRAARSRDIIVPNTRSGFSATVTFLALEGAPIKQGDRIVEFDAAALLSQKAEAERRLDEAKLKIDKTRADLESQKADLLTEVSTAEGNLRVAQLYAKIGKDLLPANTYQKYQVDNEKATLALTKAKERLSNLETTWPAQMALAEVEKAQAEIDLKKIDGDIALLEVNAPQDGIVIYGDNWASNRKIQVGDALFQGQPVLTIPDLASIQIIALLYDTEVPFLSAGMTCEFHIDAIPGRVWKGRIDSITSVANRKGFASQHKVFRAVIQPEKVEVELWKPGMTGRVEIPVSVGSRVSVIPREFLGFGIDGRYFVKKGADPKAASIQPVQVGAFNDRMVQITSGIAEGDIVLDPLAAAEGTK